MPHDDGDDGPHQLHLVAVDTGLIEGGPAVRAYLAVCGETLTASELPSPQCPDDCPSAVTYCFDCLSTANERNWDAGLDVDCPPGVRVRLTR